MKRVALHKLESINEDTCRMRVPGGWLYMTYVEVYDHEGHSTGEITAFAQTFVPDPQKEV